MARSYRPPTAFVGITDWDWFDRLRKIEGIDEVNFWQPNPHVFRALEPGEPFLFKLHAPWNRIVGVGFFAGQVTLPVSMAWEAFGPKNGVESLIEMFQWWALGLVDARPVGGVEKKGADRGIDGVISFTDRHGELYRVLVSVKSGQVNSAMVRDLKGTVEREKAAIGLFVTLDEPSKEMRLEADTAGFFHSEVWKRDYPKLQILSIRDLLELGKKPQLPPFVMPTYLQAPKVAAEADQPGLFDAPVRVKKVAEPQPHEYIAENDN